MPAFVVAQLKFTDVAAYRRYQSAFPAVFARFDAQLLAADEAAVVLEGDWPMDKIVIIAFPDHAEATRFVSDAEYQAISRDRLAGATTVSLLVSGFAPASR